MPRKARVGSGLGLGLLALSALGCQASAGEAQRVGIYSLGRQRIEGDATIVSKSADGFSDLLVLVTVDTSGRVIDAAVDSNIGRVDPAPGLAAARLWRFRPQTFDGRPVVAVGTVGIGYRKPEDRPDPSAPFPQGSAADTEIILERGACFGSCPDYRVGIKGDGTVRFTTEEEGFAGTATEVHRAYNGHSVLLPGTHVAHVDPAAVAGLIEKFRAARFFGLKSSYAAAITDASTQALTFRTGKTSKRVVDYVGRAVGMPEAVSSLEQAVDAVAGTDRWVYGNAETPSWLERTGFDFRSGEAARLAAAAMVRMWRSGRTNRAASALIMSLIDRGLPLDAMVETAPGSKEKLGPFLAYWAAAGGDEALLGRLAGKGYLAQVKRDDLNRAFAGGMGCSPAVARMLVKAGADPAARGGGTALTAIRGSGSDCDGPDDTRLVEMARTLIDLGAPLEGRDDINWTPLMGCDSPLLARLLIERGAKIDAHDEDGTTPVLATDDDRVALILLRAGANPRVRDGNGSVREQAIRQHMPATLAWLDAHGVK